MLANGGLEPGEASSATWNLRSVRLFRAGAGAMSERKGPAAGAAICHEYPGDIQSELENRARINLSAGPRARPPEAGTKSRWIVYQGP